MRGLKILAIEPDIGVRALYHRILSRRHQVTEMSNISYELDARAYDVVIVHSEEVKHHIVNIPWSRLIVAGNQVSAIPDGSWGITKPFHMDELEEIIELTASPDPTVPMEAVRRLQ